MESIQLEETWCIPPLMLFQLNEPFFGWMSTKSKEEIY